MAPPILALYAYNYKTSSNMEIVLRSTLRSTRCLGVYNDRANLMKTFERDDKTCHVFLLYLHISQFRHFIQYLFFYFIMIVENTRLSYKIVSVSTVFKLMCIRVVAIVSIMTIKCKKAAPFTSITDCI